MTTDNTAVNKFLEGFDEQEIKGTERMPLVSDHQGTYTLELVKARIAESENPKTKGKVFFKADVNVVTSNNEALPTGTRASILLMQDGFGYYQKDLAYLTAAVLGEDVKTIKTPSIMGIVDDAQPAKGAKFIMQVAPPKKEGSTFNKSFFRALEN